MFDTISAAPHRLAIQVRSTLQPARSLRHGQAMSDVRLSKLRAHIGSSLWLAPITAAAAAVGTAKLLVKIDQEIPQDRDAWYLFGGQADSARELLSTIASSLMTFTAIVFSITILVLQLASSQFSPRVLRTFLEDRFTQLSLGVFIGSFVYALALLPEVRSPAPGQTEFVPALAIFIAFVVVLVAVSVFVRYIHHIAHSIRAVHIIKRVADGARATIDEMFPETDPDDPKPVDASMSQPGQETIVESCEAGVIASVDDERLLEMATRCDARIELLPAMGDFVPQGAPLLRVAGEGGRGLNPKRLLACVEIADERTPHQDPGFGFRQLVDMAERALSPGTNDPTTAVQVLDQLHDLLRILARRGFPAEKRADASGRVRLIIPRPGWDAYVHLALDEIRQYGCGSLQVMRRMRAVLDDLLSVAPPHRRACLEQQRALLEDAPRRGFSSPRERALAEHPDNQNA
jgi:uncharacterized membrane protein